MGEEAPSEVRVSESSVQLPASPACVGLASCFNTSELRCPLQWGQQCLPCVPGSYWEELVHSWFERALKVLTYGACARIWFCSRFHLAVVMT